MTTKQFHKVKCWHRTGSLKFNLHILLGNVTNEVENIYQKGGKHKR